MGTYSVTESPRFRQGDVLRDVNLVAWAEVKDGELIVSELTVPYCVVLTQECDLEQDYTNRNTPEKYARSQDKILPSILLCPAFPAELLRAGTHLPDVTMEKFNSADWRRLAQNNNYRYHFLPEHADAQVPDLVLDFKRYFTVPREIAYRDSFKKAWRISLADLFREHLSSRFAHYLSRIGLPDPEEQAA